MSDIIKAVDLTKVYRLGDVEVEALRGVSTSIAEGEFKALVGPSGSGKTTLMHMLGCLDWPTAGELLFDGQDVMQMNDGAITSIRARHVGFIFQMFNLMASLTVKENVELQLRLAGFSRRDRSTLAADALEMVGLAERMKHKPSQLSGGERQRVAVARAVAKKPRILLADEPTGNLDSQRAQEVFEVFKNLNEAGQTIVVVTHDVALADKYCATISMRDGRLENSDSGRSGESAN